MRNTIPGEESVYLATQSAKSRDTRGSGGTSSTNSMISRSFSRLILGGGVSSGRGQTTPRYSTGPSGTTTNRPGSTCLPSGRR